MENSGRSCPDYTIILEALKGGKRPCDLPHDSEGRQMSGEWDKLSLMPGKNLIMLSEERILVPTPYRKKLIETLHANTHRKCDTLFTTLRAHFFWANMRKMIKDLSEKCQTCLAFSPAKERAKPAGLEIKFETLSPMDWLVIDCFEAGKRHFLALGDRASGMVWARKLKSMTTNTLLEVLDDFCQVYSGPPHRITSDGGSNLASAAVADWCARNNIVHDISAARSAESNGESEACVKKLRPIS